MKKLKFLEKFKFKNHSNSNSSNSKRSSMNSNEDTSMSSSSANAECKQQQQQQQQLDRIEQEVIVEQQKVVIRVQSEEQQQVRRVQLRNKKPESSRLSLANRLSAHITQQTNNGINTKRFSACDLNAKEVTTYMYKILVIGNSAVGKTSIMNRFCDNHFMQNYIDTIGVDYKTKIIKLKPDFVNDTPLTKSQKRSSSFIQSPSINNFESVNSGETIKVRLQIYDTSGAQKFQSITRNYYRGANGILLVYDVHNRKSFETIKTWMKTISDFCTDNVEIYLVANKCDLETERQVTKGEGEQLANSYGLKYIETSAKANMNIDKAFYELTRNIRKTLEKSALVANQLLLNELKKEQIIQRKRQQSHKLKINSKRKLSTIFSRNPMLSCFLCNTGRLP